MINEGGEPWDGFSPSTSKCSKYEHPSENSGFEEPGKENCCKWHFIGHWETAMCLIPNSEIHNPHIRKKNELGEDNFNFLNKEKHYAYVTNIS